MKINYDIVIVGAGPVGCALACALGNSNFKIAILDRYVNREPPPLELDPRVSAVTLASQRILAAIGVWEGITTQRFSGVRAMHVWDANGTGEIHFDAAEIGEPYLAFILENAVIAGALLARLQRFTNIHFLAPVAINDMTVNDEQVLLRLDDGRELFAALVVGADGADSPVRHKAGIKNRVLSFDQKAIVATVTTEQPHVQTAWQCFLATGPVALLPLSEPRLSALVWSADSALADRLLALSDCEFISELQRAVGARLGKIVSVTRRLAFPLTLAHAQAYVVNRVALIGDAAHVPHPLAGQGVNLGFLDAATLAEVLLAAGAKGKDIGAVSVLRRYERWRKGDNMTMLAVTAAFKYLFGNASPVVTPARNLGLRLTNAAQPIKNFIMRRAAGLAGDLPKIARRAAG